MHHSRVAKHPKIIEIIQIIVLLFELYILKHIIFILKPIICCFSKNLSPFYYTLLYALYILFIYSSITNSSCLLFLSTVLSDEDTGPPNHDDEQDPPAGMRTPPTPPPPSSPIPARVRAIAQLRYSPCQRTWGAPCCLIMTRFWKNPSQKVLRISIPLKWVWDDFV